MSRADRPSKQRWRERQAEREQGREQRSPLPRSSRRRGEPVDPASVLPMGPALTPPDSFASLFGTALRLAAVEDPDAVAEVVRSRATLSTWRSATSVPFEQAERARVETFAAWLEESARTRTARADLEPSSEPYVPDEVEPLRIPRGAPLPGDKVRRGGSR